MQEQTAVIAAMDEWRRNTEDPETSQDGGPGPSDGVPPAETAELGPAAEGLVFVAGFVASRCRHWDGSLGSITSETPAALTSSWLRAISRGGLTMPSERWLQIVREFELLFSLVMGKTVDREPLLVQRLVALLLEKRPEVDRRVARKLVTTRLHLRLRWLNREEKEGAARRRSDKQLRQHMLSRAPRV